MLLFFVRKGKRAFFISLVELFFVLTVIHVSEKNLNGIYSECLKDTCRLEFIL